MRVVITGGGTGGHLFPALAICECLKARRAETPVLFVGAQGGVEAGILPRLGQAFRGLAVSAVKGKGRRRQALALLALPRTVREACGVLREFRADVVLGVGGYASFPAVVAATLLGTPRVIHEQNAIPGLANRWLGRLASAIAVSFEASGPAFRGRPVVVTGSPVRAAIRPGDRPSARERLGLERDTFTVLVFGGSQGAHRLNTGLLEALPELSRQRDRVQFIHATGEKDLAEVRAAYERHRVRARVEPFFEDMASAYQAADFAICRAGAGTVFELAAMGLPALLVPFPFAANDHQRANAEALVTAGAAWTVPDAYCDGRRIAATVAAALEKPALLSGMGAAAQTLARPDAAERVVDLLESVARRAGGPAGH
ncbi:MAG: undecaprenyldiphospho-muramoylpentapeptide beta-N-acetylglucosaminyltransferase [candidate division NC10 bacterium]|nr:undecaprenyldiphospho-muramoylpentapeptide beta-N-acetylglucosaminyltransferase [candidate division NC10 bacterium]